MFQVQKINSTIYPDENQRRPFWLHNFMSHESPYNGLLLYHGLGSGKEEIVRMVTQEYQDYMRQTNRVKPIYRLNSAFPTLEAGALVVLDDVHKTDYSSLLPLLENVTVKLLLLSPTPMFSSPSDLIDVLNLLRLNDKRRRIDVLNPDNTLRDPETLANSVHGYVAFVQGENPTSFRIYPSMFHPKPWKYPRNKREGALVPRVDRVDVYTVTPQKPQLEAYHRAQTDEAKLMALTMSYPKDSANVFDPDILPLYSAKIAALCRSVQNPGICLVYTRFYEGVPVAHALESMGFSRHTGASLSGKPKTPLKYALWHGAPVAAEWAAAVHPDTELKVVVVTDVDGVDLVNVRQIHVLDPLPHMDRLERLLSRGVRDGSHATLPLEERNCQIYLYASLMDEEAVDMFVYRQAETNALKVGQVTRLLRMNAMNCVVNYAHPLKTVRQRLADGQTIHFPLGDKDGSAACDYLTCLSNVPARSTDAATEIARAFKRHYVLSSRELVREVRLLNPEYTRAFIVAVAREMVKRGHPLVDRVGTTGRLAYAYDTFLFQPEMGAVAQLEADLKRDPWCAVAAESPLQSPEALVAHLIESMPDASALLVEVLRPHSAFEKLVYDYFQKNKYGSTYLLLTPAGIQCFTENGEAAERELPEIRVQTAKYVGVVDGHFKVREGRKWRECGRVLKELTKTRPRNRMEACVELELLLRMTNTPSNRSFLTPLENYINQ